MCDAFLTASPILAIDLGKYKSVVSMHRGDPTTAERSSFRTDRERRHRFVARGQPSVVVIQR